jgi:hypothetical protein
MRSGAGASRGTWSGQRPLALVALLYVAAFIWMPNEGFWINDNGLKFIQVDGLVRSGFTSLAIDWPGRAFDPGLEFGPLTKGFMVETGGALYAAYSPIFALLSAPLYLVAGSAGLYVLPLLGALAALLAVRRLAAIVAPVETREQTQALAVLFAGLLTPLWFYSLTFWEHTPAVACSCWSVVACLRFCRAPAVRAAVATGGAAALACWLRADAYLLAAVVLLAAWLASPARGRDGLLLGGSFLVVLSPVLLFHQLAFGDPLGPHLQSQWNEIEIAAYAASRVRTAVNVLAAADARWPWTAVAVAPFVGVLLLRGVLVGGRLRVATPVVAVAGVLAGVLVLAGHLSAARPMNWLMVSNGLFAASPLCILALMHTADDGTPLDAHAHARRTLVRIILASALLFAAFVPEVNSRGIHWGNRFLLPLYPLLAVLASVVWVSWWKRFGGDQRSQRGAKAAGVALVGVTLLLQLYSLRLLHDRKAFTAALNARVASSPLETIVVDTWFLPVDLGPTFHDKSIFFVRGNARGHFRAHAMAEGVERALSIEVQRGSGGGEPGVDLLDDGWLNFSPVTLREVRFSNRVEP